MPKTCPDCGTSEGIREAIYGMPDFEPDEAKYFITGCTSEGGKYVCINCKWGIEDTDINVIDTTFDMRLDSNGKDPDKASRTLKRYHKYLWSKPLPNGELFNLVTNRSGSYLHFKSDFYDLSLSSDSIAHSYRDVKRMKLVLADVPPEEIESFRSLNSTIGGFIIFPARKMDGKMTINQERGTNHLIADRFDLTLECIKRHYEGAESPLSQVLNRYADFFTLFQTFRGYVDFFLLNDLVDKDYRTINFLTEIKVPFSCSPLPSRSDHYEIYRRNSMEFVESRNRRISK